MERALLSGRATAPQPGAHASQVGLLPLGQLLHLVPDFQGSTQGSQPCIPLGSTMQMGPPSGWGNSVFYSPHPIRWSTDALIIAIVNPQGQFCSISINNAESFYLLTGCKSIRENNVKSEAAE